VQGALRRALDISGGDRLKAEVVQSRFRAFRTRFGLARYWISKRRLSPARRVSPIPLFGDGPATTLIAGVLSLTGLTGRGSILLLAVVLGGLLTFVTLMGLELLARVLTRTGKENHMKTDNSLKNEKLRMLAASTANTIWAIGTGVWSGLALLG
jgi:hypothetical protein